MNTRVSFAVASLFLLLGGSLAFGQDAPDASRPVDPAKLESVRQCLAGAGITLELPIQRQPGAESPINPKDVQAVDTCFVDAGLQPPSARRRVPPPRS